MGCTSSQPLADQSPAVTVPPRAEQRVEVVVPKERVEPKSTGPSPQEAGFARELSKLIVDATASSKPKDAWAVLFKCVDLVSTAFGLRVCSLVAYTPSGQYCRLACSSGSVLAELTQAHPDLVPAAALGWVSGAVEERREVCMQSGDEQWSALSRSTPAPPPDFALLSGPRGGCSSLAVLPLLGGQRCPGALLLGHTQPLEGLLRASWLTTLLPLLSLYVLESGVLRGLSLVERVVGPGSLGGLALAVTGLGEVFEWVHQEELETRLVVLSPEGDTATVYCKVPATGAAGGGGSSGPLASTSEGMLQSIRSNASGRSGGGGGSQGASAAVSEDAAGGRGGSIPGSGGGSVPGGGGGSSLLGTHMSLDNTLTKRCLSGRQRLLFVADVMQALKLYGEPWKDIFFDDAAVTAPRWVLAAPLVHEGCRLGAVLWLSSSRVNAEVLMRTASTHASPVIHAIARATALRRNDGSGEGSERCNPGGGAPPPPLPAAASAPASAGAPSVTGQGGPSTAGSAGGGRVLSSLAHSVEGSQRGSASQGGARAGAPSAAAGEAVPGGSPAEAAAGSRDGAGRSGGAAPDVPVKYVLRHSPSTSALMRLYKSTIAQRAPPGDEDKMLACSVHEVRILSKAGEGAFGSVYVGRWRNAVVAVKIIRDTSGARSLKTAWELAVNRSLSHPAIVTVHAILTDVHLQKTANRVLRFVPAAALEAQQAAVAAAMASAASAGGGGGGSGALPTPLPPLPPFPPLPPLPGRDGTGAAGGSPANSLGPSAANAVAGNPAAGPPPSSGLSTGAVLLGGLGGGGAGAASEAWSGAGGAAAGAAPATAAAEPTASGGAGAGGGASMPAALAAAVAAAAGSGIAGSNSLPTPVASGGAAVLPNLARLSAGSLGLPPPALSSGSGSAATAAAAAAAARLKPQPPAPKVHAILMEYCNLGGLHKYIDNRMFFRDRSQQQAPAAEAAPDATVAVSTGPGPGAGPGPPLPPESLHMDFVLATLSEIASALQYLHAQGFVHCDLKPENVLLKEATNRRGFTAKLADFGLSELRSADGQVVGDLGGTVTHVAPESVLLRQVSAASDMYAFGIIMWELYTGQQPYRSLLSHISKREERHRALLARVVHEGLRPLFPLGVPQEYLALASQCWSADPAARPSTADALAALGALYARFAPPAAPPA